MISSKELYAVVCAAVVAALIEFIILRKMGVK